MNRRITLICVTVCLAVGGVWFLNSGIARAADPPLAPCPAYSPPSRPGAVSSPTLSLSEALPLLPVYTMHVSKGMTTSLTLRVSNTLDSLSPVTVTAELVEVLAVTTGEHTPDTLKLFPQQQPVAAKEAVTFTLSLIKPLLESQSYTGTLRLSASGPDLTPTKTITQQFRLQVSVSPPDQARAILTPTLRLVGPDNETLLSKPIYRVVVSDQGWQPVLLYVRNLDDKPVTIVPELLEVNADAGKSVPAMLALSPVSRNAAAGDGVSFTLSLVEGWLPEGKYDGTLRLSAVSTETVTVEPEFELLITPWAAELEWAQKEFVYAADAEHTEATVYVVARYANADSPHAELTTLRATDGVTKPVEFSTADFLNISDKVLTKDKVIALTLNFTATELPEPGTYEGTLRLSASNAAAITKTFTLVIPRRAPISPWAAELEWTQEQDEFVYEIDKEQTKAPVGVVARRGDATKVQAELTTLRAVNGVTEGFSTAGFLSISLSDTLEQDKMAWLTLEFTPIAAQLPVPGTYEGLLRLSASNAAAITKTLTLVIPEDRARGSYQLEVAELGKTPDISPSLASSLTFSTALQFTGVRWLPGSTSVVGPWWPALAGALLLGLGLAMLVGYTAWALVGRKSAEDESWLKEQWKWSWLEKVENATEKLFGYKLTGRKLDIVILMAGVGLAGVAIILATFWFSPTQARVGERTLLIWEADGRGPVREIAVVGGEFTSEIGDTGQIKAVLDGKQTLEAGHTLTVPVHIQNFSQPGFYQGRILIQSPDIAGGVTEVPVQATVHDFILWPSLVILMGVVLGGWAKYHQEIASERLAQRKALQEEWEKWDAHLGQDPYRETKVGRINPIYTRIRTRIDIAQRLLQSEPEWGIEEAKSTVTGVSGEFERYKALSKSLAELEADLEALDTFISTQKGAFQRARDILNEFHSEEILRRHKKKIQELLGEKGVDTSAWLPEDQELLEKHPEKIEELLKAKKVDTSKWSDEEKDLLKRAGKLGELKELEKKVQAVLESLSLALRDPVDSERKSLERELRDGKLDDAERSWRKEFVVALKPALDALRSEMNRWKGNNAELEAKLTQTQIDNYLADVDKCLEKAAEFPEEYAKAWGLLIQAQTEFQTVIAEAVADKVKPFMLAEVKEPERDEELALRRAAVLPTPPLLEGVEKIRVVELEPYLWSNIEWNDQGQGNVTCKLTFRVSGFDNQPDLYAYQVEPELEEDGKPKVHLLDWQPEKRLGEFEVNFIMSEKTWQGEPRKYKIVAKDKGDKSLEEKDSTFVKICSPYTIELPLGKIMEGERLFCEASFQGSEEDRAEHGYFEWWFNKEAFEGLEKGERPSGVHYIKPDESSKTSTPARIQLLVYSSKDDANEGKPIQKALFDEGRVQESATTGLYQDKRRHNFYRRLAALLLALVAGMGAKRVFGLTFGSFEEYLAAFAWGVTTGVGVDPAVGAYEALKGKALEYLGVSPNPPK